MVLDSSSRPKLWKFARVQFDDARQRSVLQYPEGAVLLNDTAAEILELCDGARTLAEIATTLE
jgi:pyrroloquinoline quinone biosynthesis protein D